jgi:hypothetical protein
VPRNQIKLVFDLETGLRDGRSPTEIGDLLLKPKRRNDLLARVATSIDWRHPRQRPEPELATVSPRWLQGVDAGRAGGLAFQGQVPMKV